jgi:hypothetical protein
MTKREEKRTKLQCIHAPQARVLDPRRGIFWLPSHPRPLRPLHLLLHLRHHHHQVPAALTHRRHPLPLQAQVGKNNLFSKFFCSIVRRIPNTSILAALLGQKNNAAVAFLVSTRCFFKNLFVLTEEHSKHFLPASRSTRELAL